ncbi:MAG TPA: hypothetical protein VMC08_02080, partial [Bacteroidales bacterium]|nr:hypothetical protein [Bacteroidales bacterium]
PCSPGMKRMLCFLIICMVVSCKKDNAPDSVTFHSEILVDTVYNYYRHPSDPLPVISVRFHIQLSPNYTQAVTARWISPDSLQGLGSFMLEVGDSLLLKVKILDQAGSELEILSRTLYPSILNDSIIPSSDYRTGFMGKYTCLELYTWVSDSSGFIIWHTDTSGVDKTLTLVKSMQYPNGFDMQGPFGSLPDFLLENDGSFQHLQLPDHGHFFTGDSMYCWIKSGVMNNFSYYGKKATPRRSK